jgi:RimJ/RimL family protein N-acetyltransferase
LDERFGPPPGFSARPAWPADRPVLAGVGPGLFESADEIDDYLGTGGAWVYELDRTPVGCGLMTPVRSGDDAMDLGVGVLPVWRGRGFGEQIIRHLKLECLRTRRGRPTCGCAVENVASRRTLEKAGFLTRHRVLELAWAPGQG